MVSGFLLSMASLIFDSAANTSEESDCGSVSRKKNFSQVNDKGLQYYVNRR